MEDGVSREIQIIDSHGRDLAQLERVERLEEKRVSRRRRGMAKGTAKIYRIWISQWEAFAKNHGYQVFPPLVEDVCEFLEAQAERGLTYASVQQCRGAINRWLRGCLLYTSPSPRDS